MRVRREGVGGGGREGRTAEGVEGKINTTGWK